MPLEALIDRGEPVIALRRRLQRLHLRRRMLEIHSCSPSFSFIVLVDFSVRNILTLEALKEFHGEGCQISLCLQNQSQISRSDQLRSRAPFSGRVRRGVVVPPRDPTGRRRDLPLALLAVGEDLRGQLRELRAGTG